MGPTRPRTLFLAFALTAAIVWPLGSLAVAHGVRPHLASWPVCILLVGAAGLALAVAWPVRQYVRGKRPDIEPLRAARAVVLAKAAALGGAVLGGFYAAQILLVVDHLDVAAGRAEAIVAGADTAAALLLMAAGLVAEWFCRIPPQDEDPTGVDEGGSTEPTPA